ncbi:putative bifunctional nuclease domain-containing protein [Dioscorea sansibarensis]
MLWIQCRPSPPLPTPFNLLSLGSNRIPILNPHHLPLSANFLKPIRLLCIQFDSIRCRYRRSAVLSCKGSSDDHRLVDGPGDGDQFIEAFLLVSETVRHYNLWKNGFVNDTRWQPPGRMYPFSTHSKGPNSDVSSIGYGFLRRYQSPTIFLKIACDEDLFLPVVVGENAIDMLMASFGEDVHEECLDLYQLVQNLVEKFGSAVKMVRITKGVLNTYYAQIFFEKYEDRSNFSIDAHPSDAITLAKRSKAPIYVSKDVVLKDAIKNLYGTWRRMSVKTVYDVALDSAADGPDKLLEELDLMKKMDIAVMEESYIDAAIWRDKLMKLRAPKDGL